MSLKYNDLPWRLFACSNPLLNEAKWGSLNWVRKTPETNKRCFSSGYNLGFVTVKKALSTINKPIFSHASGVALMDSSISQQVHHFDWLKYIYWMDCQEGGNYHGVSSCISPNEGDMWLIAVKFGSNIVPPLGMNCNHLGDPLTFHLAVSVFPIIWFMSKYRQKLSISLSCTLVSSSKC